MKLTESMLRKMIREAIDDTLDYIPPTGQTKGKGYDTSSDLPRRKTFREMLQNRAQSGKPIMLKSNLDVRERVYGRPPRGGGYSLEGEPYEKVGYSTSNIIPAKGQLFKVLKVVTYEMNLQSLMADPEVRGPRAEIINPSYQRPYDSTNKQKVIIENDELGVFTVDLVPQDVNFPR